MKYPKSINIAGQRVGVELLDHPLYQFYECPKCTSCKDPSANYRFPLLMNEEKKCPACSFEHVQPVNNTYVLGQFVVLENKIKNFHRDDLEDVCGTSFVHEIIEAIDSIKDLKLHHTQITTLAAALYQAFSTGEVDFKPVTTAADYAIAA